MLDKEDIRMIGDLLDQKLDEKLDRKLDEKLDKKLDQKLDEKLGEFSAQFDKKLEEQSARFDKKLEEQSVRFDRKLKEQSARFDEKLSRSIRESENLVLEAGERNREILERKIDDLRADVSELQQYYRAEQTRQDATELLRRQVKGLEERVEILEARIG